MKRFSLPILLLVCATSLASAQDSTTSAKPNREIQVTTSKVTTDDIIRKYINAIGGEDAIKKIKDLKIVRSAIVQQVPITVTEMRKTPNQLKIMVEGMDMVFQKVVLNKDKGYQEYQGQRKDLSPMEITGTQAEADLLAKLHPEKYNIKRELKGTEIVDSASTYVIEETDASGKINYYYYHTMNGLLIRKATNENTPQGPMPAVTSYRNYKEVEGSGGYKVPEVVRQMVGTQEVISTLKTAEVNKNIPDKEFE